MPRPDHLLSEAGGLEAGAVVRCVTSGAGGRERVADDVARRIDGMEARRSVTRLALHPASPLGGGHVARPPWELPARDVAGDAVEVELSAPLHERLVGPGVAGLLPGGERSRMATPAVPTTAPGHLVDAHEGRDGGGDVGARLAPRLRGGEVHPRHLAVVAGEKGADLLVLGQIVGERDEGHLHGGPVGGGDGERCGPQRELALLQLGRLGSEDRGERLVARGQRGGAAPGVLPPARREQVELLRALGWPGEDGEPLQSVAREEDVDPRQGLSPPLDLHDGHGRVEDGAVGVVVEQPLAVGGEHEVDPLPPRLGRPLHAHPGAALVDHGHANGGLRDRAEGPEAHRADPFAPGERQRGRLGEGLPRHEIPLAREGGGESHGAEGLGDDPGPGQVLALALRVERPLEEQVPAGDEDGVRVLGADPGDGGRGAGQAAALVVAAPAGLEPPGEVGEVHDRDVAGRRGGEGEGADGDRAEPSAGAERI